MHDTLTELKFTADETMLELTRRTKFVVPDEMKVYMESAAPDMPHMTAMCATNVIGIKSPLFIIVPELKKMPDELQQQINTGKIWLVSTQSGWMNRWAFALWTFCFLIWYQNWVDQSHGAYANKQALLVLDGHTSRENPLALQLFNFFKFHVLVLPSHTTHVLQLFDIGLAGALKEKFTREFHKNLKKKENYIPHNDRATIRKIAIDSFVEAWDMTCNRSNCVSSAASVGLEPVDKESPKRNHYVRNLTPEEQEIFNKRVKRKEGILDINNSEITKAEKINEIREYTMRNGRDKGLCVDLAQFQNLQNVYTYIRENAKENGVHMLCSPPTLRGYAFE